VVGAVLVQISEEGYERPIAFISKKLNKAQRNYTVTGARWALAWQRYNFKIEHRKGSLNVVPDSMSRVYEDVIAAVDLRKALLVDMDSEEFKKAEYVDLITLIKLTFLTSKQTMAMCIGNLSTLHGNKSTMSTRGNSGYRRNWCLKSLREHTMVLCLATVAYIDIVH